MLANHTVLVDVKTPTRGETMKHKNMNKPAYEDEDEETVHTAGWSFDGAKYSNRDDDDNKNEQKNRSNQGRGDNNRKG